VAAFCFIVTLCIWVSAIAQKLRNENTGGMRMHYLTVKFAKKRLFVKMLLINMTIRPYVKNGLKIDILMRS
jgi:hypothetical protein